MNELEALIDGARQLGVALSENEAARLLRLLDELARWNRRYNLTAIEDRGEMITHHVLDSLSVHRHLYGPRIADVGTGAGFPGLPLALANPDKTFTLIDSNSKKLRFVSHAARLLGLSNVTTVHSRVETLRPETPFDTVIARAFAALPELLEQVRPLCGANTRVLAMKGKMPEGELAALPAGWKLIDAQALSVPGLDADRSLVILARNGLS